MPAIDPDRTGRLASFASRGSRNSRSVRYFARVLELCRCVAGDQRGGIRIGHREVDQNLIRNARVSLARIENSPLRIQRRLTRVRQCDQDGWFRQLPVGVLWQDDRCRSAALLDSIQLDKGTLWKSHDLSFNRAWLARHASDPEREENPT